MAAEALDISERSVFVALEIAKGIKADIRARISALPIADRQNELIALAAEKDASRQTEIVDLLLDAESGVDSVVAAIAVLDKTPAPTRVEPWARLSGSFARLRQAQQYKFFDAHRDAITLWFAQRNTSAKAKT